MYKAIFRVIGMQSPVCAETLHIALNGIPDVEATIVYKDELAEVAAQDHVAIEIIIRGAQQNGYDLDLVKYEVG